MNTNLLRAIVLTGASVVAANATVWDLNLIGKANNNLLTGGNEVPTVDTPAQGGELSDFIGGNPGLQYDDAINELAVRIGFGATGVGYAADLEGTFLAAHIHGPADINNFAGVLHDLEPLTSLQPGGRSGTISGFITLTDTQEEQLFADLLYINIHSAVNSGGEIRANLTPVPEPQTYGMIGGAALLAFAGFRRHRAAAGK
jgi:hypothetical protein